MENKTKTHKILVVGGSGALGSTICRLLKKEKAQVHFTYFQNRQRAEELETEGIKGFSMDLRDPGEIQNTVSQCAKSLGGLTALVFSAGIAGHPKYYQEQNPQGQPWEYSQPEWEEILKINTQGAFFACQSARPFFSEQGGNMVIIGSMDGVKPVPSPLHFATSKAGLRGMVEAFSKKIGLQKICINLVAPGILEGGISTILPGEIKDEYLKHCSLKRFGKLEEIAQVVIWLALENTYVTGQALLLDGGL